jgi:hypothetical protein
MRKTGTKGNVKKQNETKNVLPVERVGHDCGR